MNNMLHLQPTACAHAIAQQIKTNGPIRFDEFMQLALYHPAHGYYTQGERIFGAQGDFITAPELTPLFGHAVARALACALPYCAPNIYEFGAGNGKLAADILAVLGTQTEQYYIIDLSGGLKEKQAQWIAAHVPEEMAKKVVWLNELPEQFDGIVIGNEVLDALPVRCLELTPEGLTEWWVGEGNTEQLLALNKKPADAKTVAHVHTLEQQFGPWPRPYLLELTEQVSGYVKTLTERLNGVALFIDYGDDASKLFAPYRTQGTLRAQSHHVAHDNFLTLVGEQDLTAHVNFSVVYEALCAMGGQLEGYCHQSDFLMGCGILDLAQQQPHFIDPVKGASSRKALHTLLAESDMGHSFKVMMWSKGVELPDAAICRGFREGDLSGGV